MVKRGCGAVQGEERGAVACGFEQRPAARLRPRGRMESARRGVGWSRGFTGEREIKGALEGGQGRPYMARPRLTVDAAYGHP